MSGTFLRTFVIGATLVLGGCAGDKSGTLQTIPIALAEPPIGMSQIVFFRPAAFVGAGVNCTVRENGKMIVRIGPGRYFVAPVQPGTHVFTAATEATDTLATDVIPNETTYVKCTIRMGVLVGRPNLSASTAGEFASVSAGLKAEDAKMVAAQIAADEALRARNSGLSRNR